MFKYKARCNKCETVLGAVEESTNILGHFKVDFMPLKPTTRTSRDGVVVFCPSCNNKIDITKNENRLGQLTLL